MTGTELAEFQQQLRAQGVTVVAGSVIDLGGVARAKTVPVTRLESFAGAGMGASPTWNTFCIDDIIAFTPNFTVVGDLRLRLDTSKLTVIDEHVAWAPAEFNNQDGSSHPVDTRALLRRITAALATDSLDALVGCELEFILFPRETGADETKTADTDADAPGSTAGTAPGLWAAYGLASVMDPARKGFITTLTELATRTGLPLEQVHAEYGRNQYEISLSPTDPVTAADNVVLARLLIGQAAAAHGFRASFSPLAATDANAANGAHQHLSLHRNGRALLSGGDGPHGLSAEGASAIAGVINHLPAFLGFFAGSVLSASRLLPGHWSGAAHGWGLENRETAVRLCAATAGNPHGANLELKVIDPSANPYLAMAALLWSAHDGITRALPLPVEITGDPGDAAVNGEETGVQVVRYLDATQASVLDALAGSRAAIDFAGPLIVEGLLTVRRHELNTYGNNTLDALAKRFRFAWSV